MLKEIYLPFSPSTEKLTLELRTDFCSDNDIIDALEAVTDNAGLEIGTGSSSDDDEA